MESPFIFTRPLQIGEALARPLETQALVAYLGRGQHCCLWGPPRVGKRTLVAQALGQMRKQHPTVRPVAVDLRFTVSGAAFWCVLTEALFRPFAQTPAQWAELVRALLPLSAPQVVSRARSPKGYGADLGVNLGTNPGTNPGTDPGTDLGLDFGPVLPPEALEELTSLPARLCARFRIPLVLVFYAAHRLLRLQETEEAGRRFAAQTARALAKVQGLTCLFCGSGSLAYRELFEKGAPWAAATRSVEIEPIEEKVFVADITQKFSRSGNLIPAEAAVKIYAHNQGHPFYTQELAHLCFSHTKGYFNDGVFQRAVREQLDGHGPHFELICAGLSRHQCLYLKALLDGVEHFTKARVLEDYHLNSSANVHRVAGALEKKGVIVLAQRKPRIADPLFARWLKNHFDSTPWIL